MSVFNFMETFFFISLGITFVLILLLVYHFKQRLGTIEQKGDTMFEIVNTMVREMSLIKSMVISQMREDQNYAPMNSSPLHAVNDAVITKISNIEVVNVPNTLDNNEIDDSDDSDDSDDEEDSDESDDESKIVVSDDECEDAPPSIKIINIPLSVTGHSLNDTIEITEDNIEIIKSEDDNSENDVSETELKVDSSEVDLENLDEAEELVVNKLPEPTSAVVESEEIRVLDETKEPEPEEVNYGKMSLYNLKNLVVSRGLATDSSKMKKPQLIQLLESSDK